LLCKLVFGYAEDVGEFGYVFGGGRGLAVEECCDGYFAAA
jgi:hypothetical protein